jgi:hypothetical protein
MSSGDDLTELTETAGAAERAALAANWKDQPEVESIVGRLRRTADQQSEAVGRDTDPDRLSPHWAALRHSCLAVGRQPGLPGQEPTTVAAGPLSHQTAAQAEQDPVAAVALARMMLLDAGVAVVQARLARIRAGEDERDAPVDDEHVRVPGGTTVSRHGPALAHGVSGEIRYVLARRPRSTVKSLAISLLMGLLYLGFIRVFHWDSKERSCPTWACGCSRSSWAGRCASTR